MVKVNSSKGRNKMLCESCRWSLIKDDGTNFGKQIICSGVPYGNSQITSMITSCNKYRSFTEKGLPELNQIAWIIEQKKGGQVGFLSPEMREKNK